LEERGNGGGAERKKPQKKQHKIKYHTGKGDFIFIAAGDRARTMLKGVVKRREGGERSLLNHDAPGQCKRENASV